MDDPGLFPMNNTGVPEPAEAGTPTGAELESRLQAAVSEGTSWAPLGRFIGPPDQRELVGALAMTLRRSLRGAQRRSNPVDPIAPLQIQLLWRADHDVGDVDVD